MNGYLSRTVVGLLVAVGFTCGGDVNRLSAAPLGSEKLPEGMQITGLDVFPAAVKLPSRYAYAQLLITARLASGEQADVTRLADVTWPQELVTISPTGMVRPRQDGKAEIKIAVAGQTATIPVEVAGVAADYPVSFVRDVMPVMSKMGCNAGTCHGSLNGKNGFKLSLRGYDPLYDHRALTDDIAGRRFNRVAPDQSLMLLKPSGAIPHVGGMLTKPGDPYYELIRAWIAAGVKLDLDTTRVTKIEIFPKNPVVPLPGMKQQIAVLATYGDGSMRDVTAESFIESGNTEVAEFDKQGLLTMVRRGEAPVLARFEGSYTATTLTVMGDRSGFAWSSPPAFNWIDELVSAKLQRVRTSPGELSTDAEFLRRVHLDLTGVPPSVETVQAFLAETRDTRTKRDEVVDRLIGNPDFVEHWTNKWADLLQVNRKFLGPDGSLALRKWIREAIASNMPYDKFVYAILTASGSSLANPPAAYFKTLRTPEDVSENTTQLFLAVRFNCNKCHDHPFERWTQNQYYHMAAFFAQVGRNENPASNGQKLGGTDVEGGKPLIEDIVDSGGGEEIHAGTGKVAAPEFPFDHADVAPANVPRRQRLAHWLVSKENPYFAKSHVNRLWGYLFGRGIIEPIDDIRAGNPATNPELLDRLTQEFIAGGFNTNESLRTICKSRTYQQSILTNRWNQDDDLNYSHAIARRLPAEVLFDTIERATGSASNLPGLPRGDRAAELSDSGATLPSGFLELFGRPPRESACECERSSGVMLGPVMSLVNGPTISEAIADGGNAITQLVQTEKDDAKLVEMIFLRVLCRPPTAQELSNGVAGLQSAGDERTANVAALAAHEQQLAPLLAEFESRPPGVAWTELAPSETTASTGATFTVEPDHAILVQGPNEKGTYTIKAATELSNISGIRLEALADPRLPGQGPGRPPNGNFVLSELKITAAPLADPGKSAPVNLQNATADFSQEGYPVANAIDNNPGTGWAVHPQSGKNHVAVFETRENIGAAGGTLLTFTLDQQYSDNQHQLGKFRLSVTNSPRPLGASLPDNIAALLAIAHDQRTPEQQGELARYVFAADPEWQRLKSVADATNNLGDKRLVGCRTWCGR